MVLARIMWQRARDTDHPDRPATIMISGYLHSVGEIEAASSLCGDIRGPLSILTNRLSHAEAHVRAGRYHEAIEYADSVAEEVDDRWALMFAKIKVNALLSLGRVGQAERVARIAVEQTARGWGKDSRFWLIAKFHHATVLKDAGRFEESKAMLRAILPAQTKLLGRDHVETRNTASVLAALE